ncbi:hypothetical protein MESS4_250065 [Mesorhizobium sp. STM 4661]|nr:hypothetical protein MESS4_250065 [Mesorhizobium sp. STM 4661]
MAGAAQDMQASEEQHLLVVRQGSSIGCSCEDCQQCRSGFFDPDGAKPNRDIRHRPLGRHGMQVVFYRAQIEIGLAIAKDCFEFFLLHAILIRSLLPNLRQAACLSTVDLGQGRDSRAKGPGWQRKRVCLVTYRVVHYLTTMVLE